MIRADSQTLTLALGVGAALIAMWVELRWPKLGPESWVGALVCAALGLCFAHALPTAMGYVASPMLRVSLAFTGLLVMFLGSLWLLRMLTRLLH